MASINEVEVGLREVQDFIDVRRSFLTDIKAKSLSKWDSQLQGLGTTYSRIVTQINQWEAGTPTSQQQALIDIFNQAVADRGDIRTAIATIQATMDSISII